MMFPPVTPVVKNLIIINVAVFFGTIFIMGLDGRMIFALYYPASTFFRPFQLITHMFMHANITHLLSNMLGLYFFGSALEMVWGPQRFLQFYLLSGLGALLGHLIYWYFSFHAQGPEMYEVFIHSRISMMGASGCVFGLVVGFGLLFPNNPITLFPIPITFPAKWLVPGYIALALFGGVGIDPGQINIAHFAHLGGALAGFIMILLWKKF